MGGSGKINRPSPCPTPLLRTPSSPRDAPHRPSASTPHRRLAVRTTLPVRAPPPPLVHFLEVEQAHLLPAPESRYDTPSHVQAKVARDHHVEGPNSLYPVPADRRGPQVEVRAGRKLVQTSQRGQPRRGHERQGPEGGGAGSGEDGQ